MYNRIPVLSLMILSVGLFLFGQADLDTLPLGTSKNRTSLAAIAEGVYSRVRT